jgi:hypothetical protein
MKIFIAMLTLYWTAFGINLGVKGGLNLSNLTGKLGVPSIKDSSSIKPGLIGGAFVEFSFGDHISLQTELLYSSKGWKQNVDFTIAEWDSETGTISEESITHIYKLKKTLSYIELPLLLKVSLPLNKISPNLYAGPTFGLNVISKYQEFGESEVLYEENQKSETEIFDFGIAFGGGVDINLGPGFLIVDLRYSLGISDNSKEYVSSYISVNDNSVVLKNLEQELKDPEHKNRVFSTLLGYGFSF